MKTILYKLALAATILLAPAVQAATINIDGLTQASIDGSVGEDIFLMAGTYRLSFIDDTYTAFSRFSDSSGCTSGANCSKGWEHSVGYTINQDTFNFGDGNAQGTIGPIGGGGYFETAAGSFANATGYAQNFTLATDTTVRFFLYDDILYDNRGGVSLSVAAVPLPAAAWLFGSALLGLGMIKRRKA
ncbi:MAG: hypothetical protein ACI9B9_001564 [Halioglobus sp.]|jgi:hypothetical protein